ncbi:MAG: hypothetical protein OEX19_07070 [Gammaproteobacteria bacterium]|nr:hypothetical protein [Gammaproteobacteria bacterium]
MNIKTIVRLVVALTAFASLMACEMRSEVSDTKGDVSIKKQFNTINVGSTARGFIMRDATGNLSSSAAAPVKIASSHLQPSHVRGARIYDNFLVELDLAGLGQNPLADLGVPTDPAAAPSGDASWQCSACHGFDYEGGVFTFNSGATNNLLELREVRGWDETYVYEMLAMGFDAWNGSAVVNVHNYSGILTEQAITDVSDFVVNEIFDTHQFIRAPASGSLGDMVEGMAIYNSVATGPIPPLITVDGLNFNCVDCHGADAISGSAGIDLVASSWADPFKWLHRSLFGSPRSLATYPGYVNDPNVMPGFYEVILTDGLHFGGPEQGAAVMAHVQAP